MQPRRRGALVLVVVLMLGIAAAGFVVLASSGGPVRPVSESTRTSSPRPVTPEPADETAQTPRPGPPSALKDVEPKPLPAWVEALWQAIVWLAITAIVALIGLLIYRVVRQVQMPEVEDEDTDWERIKADRLAGAVDSGLSRIDTGSATDAVIACWVALENAAASAGVPREQSETPAEFTVRVLGVGGISEPELVRLGELYREARYSTHGSTEEARAEARAALLRLRDELSAVNTEVGG
ncbi:DUF4129 domain-containing protein [Kribbella sp. NPDC050124]|uniref:DUF4129 domain-containing protein n=1 Tax=Kribbella sp. NPDC050124 TaxID=3364114 RepID=UPI0037AB03D0